MSDTSNYPTTFTTATRTSSPDFILTTDQNHPPMYGTDKEDGNHSPDQINGGWRLHQIARRSTLFQNIPDFDTKHHAAQDAATVAATRYFDQGTVRYALERLRYLMFAKWTQSSNPIDDWEIQNSDGWTTAASPTIATSTSIPSLSTVPTTVSDDSMSISSSRPASPPPLALPPAAFHQSILDSAPTFTADKPARIHVRTTVETDSDSSSELEYQAARDVDKPNPYLIPGTALPIWASPPPTPSQDIDGQAPKMSECGEDPGDGWLYNYYGQMDYYRFIITNPNTNKPCVAPWLKYTFEPANSTVSATFGKDYPIYTRFLRPTPVKYVTQTITPQESRLFNTEEPFAHAVDFIMQFGAPFDLTAGVVKYRFHRNAANKVQADIKTLQELYLKQLERTMESLSDLENADAVNRLIRLKNHTALDLSPEFEPFQALNTFVNGLNLPGDPGHRHAVLTRPDSPPPFRLNDVRFPTIIPPVPTELRRDIIIEEPTRRIITMPHREEPRHASKKCYKCGGIGHIRAQCSSPANMIPRARRNWLPISHERTHCK
jgi:hypothetical protein